jgi:glucosamine kinase
MGRGISLIIDKGVSLSYRHNREIKKLGGWKFPVYDLGGENWLGVETIRHTIQAKEGYIPMSDLAHNVLAKFNGKIEKITEICFKRNDPDIYCLFTEPLLRSHFTGDPAANSIIQLGFQSIHQLVDRADNILGEKGRIALSGSLANIYKSYFKPNHRLIPSSTDAEKASLLADLTTEFLSEEDSSK